VRGHGSPVDASWWCQHPQQRERRNRDQDAEDERSQDWPRHLARKSKVGLECDGHQAENERQDRRRGEPDERERDDSCRSLHRS